MRRTRRPVRLLWVVAIWLGVATASAGVGTENAAKAVAIAPFGLPAENAEREWLSEGLPRVLALRLQSLPYLRVAVLPHAPSSTSDGPPASFEGQVAPLLARLRAQGYDLVVFGRFQQVETALRAEVHLWLTQPERHLGKSLEQSSEKDPDGLAMKIATFVASALQANLAEPEGRRVGERYTNSAEAFERFAKALTLAETAEAEGEVERAIQLLREAFALDGKFAMALRQLADLHFRRGHYASAAEAYQAYLNQGRRSAAVYRLLGQAYFAQHDVPRAVEAYRRGLQLDARDPHLSVDLGLAYAAMKDYENATKALLRALEVKPDDPLAFANLGVVYLLQGNFPAATASLRRAQALQGSNATLAYNLGLSLMFEGAYDAAREQFERALELRPDFPAAAYQLALLSEQTQPDQAAERWRRYIDIAAGRASEEPWLAYAQSRLPGR
jgi:tetratricopeptide (TPR) repeat protein